jgi:thiol-disulfide isomerase/thioredoxin
MQKRVARNLLSLVIFFLLCCSIISASSTTFSLKTPNRGTIEVKEVKDGIAFKGFEDKVTVLVFIAYNGKPCLHLIEILNEMKKAHSDFDVFAVEMRKLKGDKLKEFAKSKNIEFPIIGYENAKDFTQYIAQRAGWNGSMPFILVIDKKGVVKFVQLGVIPKEGFEKIYKQIR